MSMNDGHKKIRKLYYSTAEVADMFQVNQSLLRFWEKEFPQIAPKTNDRGVRKYQQEDIELIRRIYDLVKVKGLTIPGARQRLENNKNIHRNYDVISRLNKVREELKAIRDEISQIPTSEVEDENKETE